MEFPISQPHSIKDMSSQELMAICDAYFIPIRNVDYTQYVLAYNELYQRGSETLQWALGLLTHYDYDARGVGAVLLGSLGQRKLLGDMEQIVIHALGTLIQRPIEEDNKEIQSVDAAILSLGEIGNLKLALPYLKWVFFTPTDIDKGIWLDKDTQSTATDSLEALTGFTFSSARDSIEAAKEWIKENTAGNK